MAYEQARLAIVLGTYTSGGITGRQSPKLLTNPALRDITAGWSDASRVGDRDHGTVVVMRCIITAGADYVGWPRCTGQKPAFSLFSIYLCL